MPMHDLEDEEDMELGLQDGSMEGGTPNVPRNPDTDQRRERMKSYLMSQGMGRETSPEMRAMDRAPGEALRGSDRDLALMNLMMQASNQVGTIGGKAASSAPFSEYTKQLQASNQGAMGDIQRQRGEQTAAEDRRMKMLQYLSKQESLDERARAAAAEKKAAREETADYRNKMLGLKGKQIEATAGKQKEATEGERKFGAFANRAQSANDAYEAYLKENPAAAEVSTRDVVAGFLPGGLENYASSETGKMRKQLEKEFIGSVLRPETGAAASEDEWAMYGGKYFPRGGDSPEMLARKTAVRQQDIETMRQIAGKGASQMPATQMAAQPKVPAGNAGGGTSTPPVAGAVTGGPKPGTVEDGYRFIGGDPSDPNSWEEE